MKRNIIAISLMAAGLFTFGNVYAAVDGTPTSCSDSKYTEVCEENEEGTKITIKLKKDLEAAGQIAIAQGKNVTFDLNGHTLSIKDDTLGESHNTFILLSKGSLTITGSGTVSTNKKFVIGVKGEDAKSINIGKDVTLEMTDVEESESKAINTALNVDGTAKNVTLDVYGTIKAKGFAIAVNGQQQTKLGAPVINIHDGAKIESTDSLAMYLAGYANTTIGTATITGPTGIGIKSGELTLNNTTVNATGTGEEAKVQTGGVSNTGAALLVEDNKDYKVDGDKQTVEININGGTYTSAHNSVFMEYGTVDETNGPALEELSIKDATFESKRSDVDLIALPEESNLENFISGGKFLGNRGENFKNYVAEGLEVADDGTIVDPLAPTNPSDPTNPGQTGNQENGNGSNTGDNTPDDSPQTYDGIMSYVTMALTSVGAVALSLKKVLSR